MTATTAKNDVMGFPWWVVLIQGILTLLLGILFLVSPATTLIITIQILGIYWLIDGVFSLVRIFTKSSELHWGWLLVRGVLGILAGLLVINNPLWSTFLIPAVLVLILGIYGIIAGVIGLIEAFQGGGWGAGILGVISIIFGIILVANRYAAALGLPFVLGIWGIAAGIIGIIAAFRMR